MFKQSRKRREEPYDISQRQRREEESRYNHSDNYNESGDSGSPSFQRSPERYRNYQENSEERQDEPVWQQLYRQGLHSKKLLNEKHQNSKNKIDIQCTFQPIIKHNKRYLATSSSSFLERVHVWQQNKIEKMIKEKEEEVDKNLKECTFVPKINPKYRFKQDPMDPKFGLRQQKSQNNIKSHNRNINPYYSPIKKQPKRGQVKTQIKTPTKRSNTFIELSEAKMMIRNELKRIAL